MGKKEVIIRNVEDNRDMILQAERWLWSHPQTGYTEWEAHSYLVDAMERLGYKLVLAGNIPGFYADIDTGIPGAHLCIMAELDALDVANHPESVNGMAHCCGHNAQAAALLGIAAALKRPNALDGLCGKIRLMAVPAEEMIQLKFREKLIEEGVIHYLGGKVEFMHRGFFAGIDLVMMAHGEIAGPEERYDFCCQYSSNGCLAKVVTFRGKASHAGAAPHLGRNAQYAAILGLQACNALRETLQEKDTVRFHPILLGAKCAVNVIPDEMQIESFVRGGNHRAIKEENRKFNRALAGAALAIGCEVEIKDRHGYSPERHDKIFMKLVERCCVDLVGEDRVDFDYTAHGTGSSDFGDLTCVIPGVQFGVYGATGTLHGTDYYNADPERLCINSAKAQLLVADMLLRDGAVRAKEICENYDPEYSSIEAYFAAVEEFTRDFQAVSYGRSDAVVRY